MRSRILIAVAAVVVLVSAIAASPALAAKRRVPFGFFGTVLDPNVTGSVSGTQLGDELGMMSRNGVESVRSNLFWSTAEPAPGTFDWSASDRLVLAAAEHHLSLLPIVEYTPKWASSQPNSRVYANYPPRSESSFGQFMTALVDRYGPHGSLWMLFPALRRYAVRDWQIWNEPAGNYDWAARPWPSTYLGMLRAGYTAVHAADHGAKVVLAAMVALNLKSLEPWTEARDLYTLGARRYFDIMAVNAFTYSTSVRASVQRSVKEVSLVRAVMRRFGDGRKPIWVTEVTWPASLGKVPKKDLDGFETTAAGQAKRLQAYFSYVAAHRRSTGIDRAFWYTWATSYDTRKPSGVTPTFAYSGLTRWLPGSHSLFHPLPILSAYRGAALKLEGCRKSSVATRCA